MRLYQVEVDGGIIHQYGHDAGHAFDLVRAMGLEPAAMPVRVFHGRALGRIYICDDCGMPFTDEHPHSHTECVTSEVQW